MDLGYNNAMNNHRSIARRIAELDIKSLGVPQVTESASSVDRNQVVRDIVNAIRQAMRDQGRGVTSDELVAIDPTDQEWLDVIVHPSVVLIVGKRGSGKSALGYRLLELLRFRAKPYVLGVPEKGQRFLPGWLGAISDLADAPPKSIILIDEAYLKYHARESQKMQSKEMSRILNLSRQRGQTLIFVTPEARQVDRNITSSANVVIFKDLGILQLEFDRPELNKLATEARRAFEKVEGDRRGWSYVYSPDTDFVGLLENCLPSFWTSKLSHLFAQGGEPATREPASTREEKIARAKQLRQMGLSYRKIGKALGVTEGTAYNYVNGYPYSYRWW